MEIGANLELAPRLARLVETAARLVSAKSAVVYLQTEDTDEFRRVAAHGVDVPVADDGGPHFLVGETLPGRAAETQGAAGHYRGIVNSTDPKVREWLAPVRGWGKPEDFGDFVVPIRPEQFNTRVRLQRGCFTLHVPKRPGLTEKENDSLRTFVVPTGHKEAVYRELKLSGIDEIAIFGDLENLAVSLKASPRR